MLPCLRSSRWLCVWSAKGLWKGLYICVTLHLTLPVSTWTPPNTTDIFLFSFFFFFFLFFFFSISQYCTLYLCHLFCVIKAVSLCLYLVQHPPSEHMVRMQHLPVLCNWLTVEQRQVNLQVLDTSFLLRYATTHFIILWSTIHPWLCVRVQDNLWLIGSSWKHANPTLCAHFFFKIDELNPFFSHSAC